MIHLILDRNNRPMDYLIEKPTLQLDNHQILSIEIVFHTQYHIDSQQKTYLTQWKNNINNTNKETKSPCHQVDKRSLESKVECELYDKTKVQLRNFINASWFHPPNNESIEAEVRTNTLYQHKPILPS